LTRNTFKEKSLPGMLISSKSSLAFDYIIEEVFNKQPPQIQDFLLKTSILDNLYGPLCDSILESKGRNGQELLHTLYHANLFLLALDYEEHWFRYYLPFRKALLHILQERSPAKVPVLYLRASEWCDKNGFFEEAIHYADQAGDTKRIVELMEKCVIVTVSQNKILYIISLV
jgi:LuxR family maltose regulon positive regulatory protein